jgi:LPXTG-motif cell wall-anchored protein
VASASAQAVHGRRVAPVAPQRVHGRRVASKAPQRVHARRVALPETGGASLIVLGAGGLLVAGLVARRMTR